MIITTAFPHLDEAINEESWQWLDDNVPAIATAVLNEVKAGKTPEQIATYVMKRTQRSALALRCKQAAAYLHAQKT